MKQGFLQITNINSGKSDGAESVMGDAGLPAFRNFRFSNIRVTDVPTLVDITKIHPQKPIDGLTLTNITGTCAKGIALVNVKNVHLSGIKVTGFAGPLLSTAHVTGTGLTGAVPIKDDAPKLPDPLPEPTTPYQLH